MSVVNYLSVDFNVSPRIIWIDTTLSTSISVQNLIDTCGYLSAQQANMDNDILLESSGKEYLVADGSVKVGLTVTLNNCKIGFVSLGAPDWILCSLEGGNVVAVEDIYTDPRVYIPVIHPTAYISMERVSSSSATLSELSAIQYASFGGGVTIDVINGTAGTTFPIGTIESPSNNVIDSAAIANKRGFNKFFIKGDITLLNTTNLEKYTIQGESIMKSKIIIEPEALVFGTEFIDATITGTLDGSNTIHHCAIQDLNYVQGHIHNCLLEEYTITLDGIIETAFLNCWSSGAAQDTIPIIDMGGAGKSLIIRGHSGGIKFINKSGPESATLDFESGRVILDDTITAGNITIRGIGQVEDNSTGTAVVDVSGVMSKQTITEISWDVVYIDTVNGYSGITFPIGTSSKPSNNIYNAITIADDNSIKTFKIRGAIDLPQTFEDWTFIGVGSLFSDVINLNNQNINRCRFETLTASGTLTTTYTHFTRCKLLNVSGLSGLLIDSALQGDITMGGPGSVLTGQNIGVYGNIPGAPAVLNMVGAGRIFQASLDGAIQFSNANVGSYVEVGLKNGIVIIDPTCIGGTASFTGVGNLINYSAMTVYNTLLTESSIADAVWEEDLNNYTSGAAKMQQAQMFGKEVVIDANVGVAGTDFPTGTRSQPVNNLTDALAICTERGLLRIMTRTSLTVEAGHNVDEISFATHGIMGTQIIFQEGCSANKVTIRYASVSGVITLGDMMLIESCQVGNLANFTGILNLVSFSEGCEISVGSWANMIDCYCGGEPTNEPEINIGTSALSITCYCGNLKLTNKTGSNRTIASFRSGSVSIASSCIAGKIQILGTGQLEKDESGPGCQVDVDAALTNEFIADHVWDESMSNHTVSGTTGKVINDTIENVLDINTTILRNLGLSQENYYLDQTVYVTYQGAKLLTDGRIRVYNDAVSVGTDSNIIATYIITATWIEDKLQTYKVVKQ